MLVLLDGSTLAEVVFSYARELAVRLGLELDLLHVCKSEDAQQLPMRTAYIENMAEKLREQTEKVRRETAGGESKSPVKVVGKVVVGYPAEEILDYAVGNNIDVIMLATHGRSGVRRWGLGSVADKVIHQAGLPIWLIPSALHEGILYDNLPGNNILVPLDGSARAESVLPYVISMVKQRGVEAQVLLINVASEAPKATGDQSDVVHEKWSTLQTQGEAYLREVAERLKKAGLKTGIEQLIGDASEEIVRYAAAVNPRFIIMATHGRSGLSRFMFASVTEDVLRRLQKTPLLLVPPEKKGD